MIDLYLAATANGYRASVALEEAGLAYSVHKIDLQKGDHRTPAFLKLNPAGLIPVIVDHGGPGGRPITVSQSGAIILYAAEKCGRFMPADATRRSLALQWFMQVATDVCATSGALFRVEHSAPDRLASNTDYFRQRLTGFFRTCEDHLADHEYFADEISVADIYLYPNYTLRKALIEQAGEFPNLQRWGAALGARPAVQKGMKVLG